MKLLFVVICLLASVSATTTVGYSYCHCHYLVNITGQILLLKNNPLKPQCQCVPDSTTKTCRCSEQHSPYGPNCKEVICFAIDNLFYQMSLGSNINQNVHTNINLYYPSHGSISGPDSGTISGTIQPVYTSVSVTDPCGVYPPPPVSSSSESLSSHSFSSSSHSLMSSSIENNGVRNYTINHKLIFMFILTIFITKNLIMR
jgi:hypothetical protein